MSSTLSLPLTEIFFVDDFSSAATRFSKAFHFATVDITTLVCYSFKLTPHTWSHTLAHVYTCTNLRMMQLSVGGKP